ncbi:MAG: SAM-dependent methyltransferase [Sciscionella sp.]
MSSANPMLGSADVSRPSSARIYDYFLGGAHNFEVDRVAAQEAQRAHPAIGLGMRANRSFLQRAVRMLASEGVDQFLDLGSGIPTVGNVHEIAQRANPDARIVYVDIEAIAVAHSKSILRDNELATVIRADLQRPEEVLVHPDLRELLDLSRPIAVIIAGVLQYVDDENGPARVVAGYRDRLASGSYLAMSHPSVDDLSESRGTAASSAVAVYDRTETPFTYRSRAQFVAMFAGLALVEPGVVKLWEWRPEPGSGPSDLTGKATGFAGVGRKP